jgi:hypothetical protein
MSIVKKICWSVLYCNFPSTRNFTLADTRLFFSLSTKFGTQIVVLCCISQCTAILNYHNTVTVQKGLKNESDANEGRFLLFISAILSGAASIAFETKKNRKSGHVLMH